MLRRKTIGLLINDLDGNYQTILWLMIKKAAEKFDCNLIVFEGRTLMCGSEVDKQHHIIYEFADKARLDGLIMTSGTLSNFISKSMFMDFVKKYNNIPVMSLGEVVPGTTSLVFDNKQGMKSLVRHLINEHGYKRIIFVTGPESNDDSHERYEAYCEVLAESNIQFDEDLVFHGDFMGQTGYIIMNEIDLKEIEYDAIIYANDDMAQGAMQYLKDSKCESKGVAICGFDDSMNSSLIKPALTTVRQPIGELCNSAVELLLQKLDGVEVDEVVRLPAIFIKRESCGCEYKRSMEETSLCLKVLPSYRVHENVQTYSVDELFVRITNSMQRCFIRSCFISTYTEGAFVYDGRSILDNSLVFPEKSNLIYAYYNFQQFDVSKENCNFNTKDIVPDRFLPIDRRFTYLVNPLFFIKEQFGFVVFEVENDDVINYEPLRGEISNTLKNALMLIERENMEKSLLENERLVSLGQLIGGISHNLLTPIMSIAGSCDALDELINEFANSIGNDSVVIEDYMEIAGEMVSRVEGIRGFMSYMSNVITTVRGQAVQLNSNTMSKFTLSELTNQIEFVKNNNEYLKKFQLDIKVDANVEATIVGDIGNLILIIRNILINAVEAYDTLEESKRVEIYVKGNNDNVLIKIKDYGRGIPNLMKSRIFTSMFTTKGKNGNGLSLMLSYSTIKAKYGGDMWYESELDKGTTFYISIPLGTHREL